MPAWLWIGLTLTVLAGIFVYRHLIWMPKHSALNEIEELPHLRETIERLSRLEEVSALEEDWRFALTVTPTPGRYPRDNEELHVRDTEFSNGYSLVKGQENEPNVDSWEITVNKKANEWIAHGLNGAGNQIVEYRASPGSLRQNYWAHSKTELGLIAQEISADIERWVRWLTTD